jgi:RimJ/RimL family protein N-acetyltransferase
MLKKDSGAATWVMDSTRYGGSELLGVISLHQMDRNQSEVGYWVAPAMWNTGFASEAVHALVDANPFKNSTIFASVFQDNPGSARVLTNAGFDYLGDAEAFCVARGAKVATWTYLRRLG